MELKLEKSPSSRKVNLQKNAIFFGGVHISEKLLQSVEFYYPSTSVCSELQEYGPWAEAEAKAKAKAKAKARAASWSALSQCHE